MTTPDPTITIAGLEARINSLRSAVQHSNRTTAERVTMFVEASSNADRLTAERDALAAQLAEARAALAAAPKVCAIHSYEHGPGPCLTCGAWPPGTRELIAACQTRIAGLEQAAGERGKEVARLTEERDELRRQHAEAMKVMASMFAADAEVARLTARVAELEARPVLTVEILDDAMSAVGYGASVLPGIPAQLMRHLGPVTLPPAQDRADELVSAWRGICTDTATCDLDPAERMRRALASLGAPPTSPTQDDPMRHHESRDYALQSPANGYWPADVGAVNGTEAMVMGAMLRSVGPLPVNDTALLAMARAAIKCIDGLGAPAQATTPTPSPADVFAGMSLDELARVCRDEFNKHPGGDAHAAVVAGLRAVLARLRVTLVKPVDPEQLAANITAPIGDAVRTGEWKRIKEAARATLTAAGIPVTPERGK